MVRESGCEKGDADELGVGGVRIRNRHFDHPICRQLYGTSIPYLSVIDLLFNEGPTVFRSCGQAGSLHSPMMLSAKDTGLRQMPIPGPNADATVHVRIIREVGSNYDGDLERAKHFIKASKRVGADGVKFQTMRRDKLVHPRI